ncbi:hypothetical protein B6U98_06040 [Thermoplasmatales archaeon ex4572_165]|nr:MAG: hypothetical protein B6U98_06040 [Thermoplasmatales archaeon ex4572_165]
MTCFIISYEAATKESNKVIIKTIQNYKINNQIFENTWAVVTDDEATDIRDALKQVISSDDRIFVMKSGAEAGWANVICEKSWLHEYLMNEY